MPGLAGPGPGLGLRQDSTNKTTDAQAFEQRAPRKKTSFLDLPAEIRNEVYHYAFKSNANSQRRADVIQDARRYPVHQDPDRGPGALLLTCHEIRQEATPIYLHNRTLAAYLSFDGPGEGHYSKRVGSDDRLEWWLSMMGPGNVLKIERLELVFDMKSWRHIAYSIAERLNWTWRDMVVAKVPYGKICKEDVLFAFGLDGLGLRQEAIQVFYKKNAKKTVCVKLG